MNSLIQNKAFLLGSPEAISELAKKEKAKILAVSDSHGRPEMLRKILEHFSGQADLLVFCGDGSEDMGLILSMAKEHGSMHRDFPPVAAIVHGNGDDNSLKVDFDPNPESGENALKVPAAITVFAAGMNILVTHGHMFGVYYGTAGLENHAKETGASLVLFGHTHIADRSENNGITFINPGSCSLPRQGLPPSCALLEISDQKNISCTFYEIKISLSDGISFAPFAPELRRW